MKKFLAQIRRVLLSGTVSLTIYLVLSNQNTARLREANGGLGIFAIFISVAPILYLIFNIVSVAYIRKTSIYNEIHKRKPFVLSMLECLWRDLISPFTSLRRLLAVVFNFHFHFGSSIQLFMYSKVSAILWFVWMIVIIVGYLSGVVKLLV